MYSSDDDWEIDVFKPTVSMSTYLVAFVISDFKKKGGVSKNGIIVEVAGRPEYIDNGYGAYALNETKEIIDFHAEYFDVPYPLDKSSNLNVFKFKNDLLTIINI